MPIDEIDLLLLKGIADTASIAAAARAAGLPASVAARRLTGLERRLHAVLMTGDGERMRLTQAGRTLLTAGTVFVGVVAAAAQRIADLAAGRPPGIPRLRLAGFGSNWDQVADDLSTHAPGMLLEVTQREPSAAAELYDAHRVDAVYAWHEPDRPMSTTRPAVVLPVLDEPLWVALPASHPSAGRAAVVLRALAGDRWICGPTEQSRALTHAVCTAEGFAPFLGYTAGSGATERSMISHAVGIALVSPLTLPAPGRTGIVVRPLRDPPHRRLVLRYDPEVVETRLAGLLARRLRACYAATAARRNPGYRAGPDFPVSGTEPGGEPEFDPALLAGLRALDAGPPPTGDPRRLGLSDLHLLRVVYASGSLNRAARVLLISQPALSRRIHRLESSFGLELFVRSHRGTDLAPAARTLLAEIAGAEAAFRSALASITLTADPPGTPRVPVPSHTTFTGLGSTGVG